ncbi:MAG TPA: sigma-54-dependent Fis family transcriptional regulator, partial [Proteobacteria bacterium]|nr:sigma-54-dependent Fis family transcriptional regulator [Pseudomonadota bacterium]
EDLYYRLNVFSIIIPPLRERKDDIFLLVDYFADNIAREKGIEPIHFSKEVMDIFMEYDWKGNIRELQNVVEYAAVVCLGSNVYLDDLPRYLLNYKTGNTSEVRETGNMGEKIKEVEKNAIITALKEHNNNKSAAMRSLGISRRTFYKKLKQYEIA